MKKIIFPAILIVLISSLFLAQVVSGLTGFGPAEIFTSNQRDLLVIGKATLINGDDVPKYGVFSIIMPYSNRNTFQVAPSEIIHARVVCNECGEEMQRYEAINDYEYGDSLHGICTSCGSNDLIFYDEMPRDEYNCLSLEGSENFHLEKISDHTYRTNELITPGGACSVNLLYNASESYLIENYKKHWEVHLRGTTQENKEEGDFMTGGIDLRILVSFKFPLFLDIISDVEKGKNFAVKVVYGNADRTWERIPERTKVTFNGITKTVSQEGITSFVFPETRGEYEYEIEAESDHYYLPITMLLKSAVPTNEGTFWSIFENIYVIIGIIIVVIIVMVVIVATIPKKDRRDRRYTRR
jgi:hypothetical protein